jgi:hypothetical protein
MEVDGHMLAMDGGGGSSTSPTPRRRNSSPSPTRRSGSSSTVFNQPLKAPVIGLGTVAQNQARGAAFERQILRELKMNKNTQTFQAPDDRGRVRGTTPDAVNGRNTTEIKGVRRLYRTSQLQRQFNLQRRWGGRHRIIVRSDTRISKPLSRAAKLMKAKIVRYQGNGVFSAENDPQGRNPLLYNATKDDFEPAPKPPAPPPPPDDDGDDDDDDEGDPCLLASTEPVPCDDGGGLGSPYPDVNPNAPRVPVPRFGPLPIPVPVP